MNKTDIAATWDASTRSWVAVSFDPPARTVASGLRIAVRRLTRNLRRRPAPRVSVELPAAAKAAVERYLDASADLARRQAHVLEMQLELAHVLIENCGLNRSEVAVTVGLSDSHLGKLLDGKLERDAVYAPHDPAASLSAFVSDERIGKARYGKR